MLCISLFLLVVLFGDKLRVREEELQIKQPKVFLALVGNQMNATETYKQHMELMSKAKLSKLLRNKSTRKVRVPSL